MHIVVDTQGTDREPEEGGCKRDSSIAGQPYTATCIAIKL